MPNTHSRGSRWPRLIPSLVAAALVAGGLAATAPAEAAQPAVTTDYTTFVNPFMSTQGDNGQNIPGAQVPHGLAKPNPMTAPGRTHTGYDYAQSNIKGFTLTNLDGVGGSGAGGDVLVVPTYKSYNARPQTSTYVAPFAHSNETAVPGYYQVGLAPTEGAINAELTATVRSGLERFTFAKAGAASLVFDLQNNFTGRTGTDLTVKSLTDGRAELYGNVGGTFNGYNYKLYFDAVTSVPVTSVQTWGDGGAFGATKHRTGSDSGAVINLNVTAGQAVQLTTTLSPISVDQARKDQASELTGKSFEDVRQAAHDDWAATLGKVAVTSDATSDPDGDIEKIFYTSLYRMLATPSNATSTDGTYRGVDGAVHHADGYTHYDGWGTWDDFRKYSVLATMYPDVYADLVQSLVDLYADDANVGNATLSSRTMAVPTVRFERSAIVIADAVSKGVHLDRLAQSYPALVANSNTYNSANQTLGYIAGDPGTTVATSYDDYALSVIAKALGKTADATTYAARSANYKNVLRPGAWTAEDGTKVSVLDSKNAAGSWASADLEQFQAVNLYQGTLWQFNWYPSQDMAGLIDAMGGLDAAKKALSHYFGEEAPDDGTKMLKSNANEVDLQTPYLFNYLGQPAKTQKWVRDLYTKETWQNYIATGGTDGNNPPSSNGHLTPPIKTKVFKNEPLGFLPTMDDDTGAMSATFVAAALGLYPVTAGSSQYQVGSPFFPRVEIAHADGTSFSIAADGVSPDKYYIQSATLNGKPYSNTWVDYSKIAGNGSFDVTMGSAASTWGADGTPAFSASTPTNASPATATISSDTTTLQADATGKVDAGLMLTLSDATFAGADGDELVTQGKASVVGLGAGVAATVTRRSSTTAEVHLTGTLATIAKTKFAVQFSDAAFTGAAAADVSGVGLTMGDPFAVLVTSHWRSLLAKDYAEARLIAQGNYSVATYNAVDTARATARTVLADDAATDERIADADAALVSAVGGLTLSEGAFSKLQAIEHDSWSQATTPDLHNETNNIGGTRPGSWIGFNGIGFFDEKPDKIQVNYSGASNDGYANAKVEVRVGSPTGTLIATVATPPTSPTFGTFATASADLSTEGVALLSNGTPQKVYFVFTGSNPEASDTQAHWVGNFAWMQFVNSAAPVTVNNDVVLTPSNYTEWSGASPDGNTSHVLKVENCSCDSTAKDFGGTYDGGWVKWSAVDFTKQAVTGLNVRYVNNSTRTGGNSYVDVFLDSMTGPALLSNVALPATGTDWNTATIVSAKLASALSGTHDVYVVMHTGTANAGYVANLVSFTFTAPVDTSDGATIMAVDAAAAGKADGTPDVLTDTNGLKIESCACDSTVKDIGGTYDGAWLQYKDVSFNKKVTSVSVRYVNNTDRTGLNPYVDIFLDSRTGTPVATVPLPGSANNWNHNDYNRLVLPETVTGVHDVYVVMHISGPKNSNYVSNFVSFTFNYGVDKTALQKAYNGYTSLLSAGARYVDADFAIFMTAMESASDILSDDTAVASSVASALRTLSLAAGQLAPRAQRSLIAAVTDTEVLDLDGYVKSSVDALTVVVAESTTMLEAGKATDAEYTAQAAKLEAAIAALEPKQYGVPGSPQAVSATSTEQTLTVSWAAPLSDGNSPIMGYEVQLEGGEPVKVAADVTSYTFTGLKRGASYRATVKAVNTYGLSPASAYTALVPIASTIPAVPDRPLVLVSGQAITVSWAAPEDGGSQITRYVVRLSNGAEVEVAGTQTSTTFTALAAGEYSAQVAARNVNGVSEWSKSSAVAPVQAAPAVTAVTATAPSWSQVQVQWTANGTPRYVVEVSLLVGGQVVASHQAWSSETAGVNFTGLAPDTAYQVRVAPLGGTASATATVSTPARPAVRGHAVRITGKAKVRKTLSVNAFVASWSPGSRLSYVWLVNGKVAGTGAKLKLTKRLKGKRIVVRVTGTLGDWTPATVTSKAVKVKR